MAGTNGTILGQFNGTSLAAAWPDSNTLDILQIVGEGGKVLANCSATGTVSLAPAAPTNGTSLGVFYSTLTTSATLAQLFANAFLNPTSLDIWQVYSQVSAPAAPGSGGQVLIARLNSAGVFSTT